MATRTARTIALLTIVALVSGCGLPRSGPTKKEIFEGSVQRQGNAFVVTVDDRVASLTATETTFGFSDSFRKAGLVGSDTISSGDTLGITIFENVKDEPLLGNTGQRVSALTELQVDGQGYIFIPYAGRIRAAGQTPEGLRQAITRNLENQTPDPQITVQRLAGNGSSVSISGSAAGPGVYPIEAPTRTLSTMLAKSGGVTIPPNVAIVRVTRGSQTGKIWLNDLYENPGLDIALRPGDKIVVEEDKRKFVAIGATGQQSLVPFEYERLTALEAVATVGGLSTASADPTGVFVLRDETPEVANAVLGRRDLKNEERFVYVLDLTSPNGLFEARDFLIRDGDTVYVTEAPFVQWQKTLSALTGATGAAQSIASTAGSGN
ncbi:MAG: polysaccharide export protein [Tabrizicola sp.]|nr:polysaccharide export protein [Tabrizicola sp.]